MRVLGVRAANSYVRYAILENDNGGGVTWLNSQDEHKWILPKAATSKQLKIRETYKEFSRLITKYKPDHVAIKIAESIPGKASGLGDRTAIEALVIFAADQHGKAVSEQRYRQMRHNATEQMNSSTVEGFVLKHVTKSPSGWDKELVDALAVGLRAVGK